MGKFYQARRWDNGTGGIPPTGVLATICPAGKSGFNEGVKKEGADSRIENRPLPFLLSAVQLDLRGRTRRAAKFKLSSRRVVWFVVRHVLMSASHGLVR